MLRLIVFLSAIGTSLSRPDVSLGYQYGQSSNALSQSAGVGLISTPSISRTSLGSSNISPTSGDLFEEIPVGVASEVDPKQPIVTKHFYIHTAPEENDIRNVRKHFKIGTPQVHYRVVFIKAPSSQNSHAFISAEYAPVLEKTAIYLLSQKSGELSVGDLPAPPPTEPSRPEVYVIKYNTEAEAEQAQRQIQAQYDSLGGTSQVSNEGVATVTSVSNSLPSRSSGIVTTGTGSKYLPP